MCMQIYNWHFVGSKVRKNAIDCEELKEAFWFVCFEDDFHCFWDFLRSSFTHLKLNIEIPNLLLLSDPSLLFFLPLFDDEYGGGSAVVSHWSAHDNPESISLLSVPSFFTCSVFSLFFLFFGGFHVFIAEI